MHSFAHQSRSEAGEAPAPQTQGWILNRGWSYDLGEWFLDTFLLRGKLRELRQRTAGLARLQPGEKVLDVGCGTGTLTIEAQQRVGATGRVCGVDPGPQQIARARAKAARRSLPIDFQVGVIEQLPFPDGTFDVVLSTLMMHHLPDDLKRHGLAEIARVLEARGRLVIADFKRPEGAQERRVRLGAGDTNAQDLLAFVKDAGFTLVETQDMPFPRFHGLRGVWFVSARKG